LDYSINKLQKKGGGLKTPALFVSLPPQFVKERIQNEVDGYHGALVDLCGWSASVTPSARI